MIHIGILYTLFASDLIVTVALISGCIVAITLIVTLARFLMSDFRD